MFPRLSGLLRPVVVLLLLPALAMTAWAQIPEPATASTTAPGPRVTAVTGGLELGNVIRIEVAGLGAWMAANANDGAKLVPVIDGLALVGCYPIEVHATENHVQFQLEITAQNRAKWIDLLGAPEGMRKPVTLSVAVEGQAPFATDLIGAHSPLLTLISPFYGWISLVVVVVTVVSFVLLARKTGIIRESDPVPTPGKLRPYNLGRAQMAFWFLLTFTSYIVIWLITDTTDTITVGLLGLMGISATTALSEVVIDANKDATAAAQAQAALAEKQALEQSIAGSQAQLNALTAKPELTPADATARESLNRQLLDQGTRLNLLTQQLKATAPVAAENVSGGFLRDVLSDGQGYSFHRFQIFAWTVALGIVFVSTVYNSLAMPEFSPTLLGLMGMSSGTYIGFKFPESR